MFFLDFLDFMYYIPPRNFYLGGETYDYHTNIRGNCHTYHTNMPNNLFAFGRRNQIL